MNKNETLGDEDKQESPSVKDMPSSSVTNTNSEKRTVDKASRKSQRKVTRSSKSDVIATRKRTNPVVWLALLLNTLLSVALIGSAIYGWLQWQKLQATQVEKDQQLKTSIESALATKLDSFANSSQQQVNELVMDVASKNSQTDVKVAKLSEALAEAISNIETDTSKDWDAEEIAYLVKMAQRKVTLENNISGAIGILLEAERLLRSSDENDDIGLRQAIAVDVQSLKALKLNNPIDGAIAITALFELSESLQFSEPAQYYDSNTQQLSEDPGQWWQNLKILWSNLVSDFLTVEKLDEPLQPYLDKQQQAAMRISLRYSLLTARHAILNLEKDLYERALSESLANLHNFDEKQAEYTLFAMEIESLLNTPFPVKVDVEFTAKEYLNRTQKAESE